MSLVNQESVKSFLNKIADDQEFAAMVVQTDDPEEIRKKAAAVGIDLTMEDIMASREVIDKILQESSNGELSEEELEGIAGGIWWDTAIKAAGIVAGLAIRGAAAGIAWTIDKWKW